MSTNHTGTMNHSMHEFFYTVGLATTTGIAYYIWNNFYPITLNRLIADTAWNAVRLQTRAQIILNKVEDFLYPWFTSVVSEEYGHEVTFYLDGVEVESMTYLDALKTYRDVDSYNKVSYELKDDSTGETLLMLRDSLEDIMDKGLKKSNTKFISVSIKREGKDDLEVDMTQYGNIYMVGNELFSKSFIKWLLPEFDTSEDYTISTIDDNVNMVSFKKNQYIVLNENGYNIKTLQEEEVDGETSELINNEDSGGLFSWFTTNKAKDE